MVRLSPTPPHLSLPEVGALTWKGDLAARMVTGIHKYLDRATRGGQGTGRPTRSPAAARKELARIIGVVDERLPVNARAENRLSPLSGCSAEGDPHADEPHLLAQHVRWDVLQGVEGEGLLLMSFRCAPQALVIAIPDADQTPEMIAGLAPGLPPEGQFARRLAEAGCLVLVPTLINRDCEWSGVPGIMTNEPHREFIYRAAYELGRHIIGYEVQKVLAGVDWLKSYGGGRPVGVIGYGEGGLIAFHAAALDQRLEVACVSGYFGPREGLYAEPIYRNVWNLVREFGDAELARLIAPRELIVEHCPFPAVSGPPPVSEGRSGAAPGEITTPSLAAVEKEIVRAEALLGGAAPITLVQAAHAGSDAALTAMLTLLGCEFEGFDRAEAGETPAPRGLLADSCPGIEARQKRQFDQLVEHTQHLMREAEFTRREYWSQADATDVKSWLKSTKRYRKLLWEEVIGALPEPTLPLNPRARQVLETDAYRSYEIVLDVFDEVFAHGILLVPKDIAPGERRPVVVCQHGLEGRPQDVADPTVEENCYHTFACQLAERGFVTFSPQNPYIGGDAFRVLQRLANPLKLSLFSFIIRQHQCILQWLKALPFTDAKRIGFYGLSYGGKTAMRVPAILEDYCLSICSGDYNEWIWKNCSARHMYSYLRTGEYEMFEFDLGNTFNYAEMSWLICPRPFMVERGHWDGVAPDEWVAYEFAKTRNRYDLLGIGDRTELEFFNGPHEINGVGTFAFLERHLGIGTAPSLMPNA
jgi:dienelactone hydrolase